MDFNRTPHAAQLARAQLIYRDLMLATIVVKASFETTPDGSVAPATEPLPLSEADAETPLGNSRRHGSSEAGLRPGRARPHPRPRGKAASHHAVEIEIDRWKRRVLVFGDRVWRRQGDRIVASSPEPFLRLP
jgi:hypothetical protein